MTTVLSESTSDPSLPFHRKFLLTAATSGVEMIVAFEYLYAIPLLQVLGVPVTYLSMYPVLTAPAGMLVLNLIGRFSDKGSNHKQRKIITLLVVSAFTILGMVLILLANFTVLSNEDVSVAASFTNTTSSFEDHVHKIDTEGRQDVYNSSTLFQVLDLTSNESMADIHTAEAVRTKEPRTLFPIPAVLGFVGIAMMDTGYDLCIASSRACVLACSSSSDHTVLLLLALVQAALGGCAVNLLGLLDLAHLVHLAEDQGSLIGQATVQLMICGLCLLVTVMCTVLASLVNISSTNSYFYSLLDDNGNDTVKTEQENEKVPIEETPDTEIGISDQRISIASRTQLDVSDKESKSYEEEEFVSLLSSKREGLCKGDDVNGDINDEASSRMHCCEWNRPKVNIIVAFICGFLCSSCMFPYNNFVTDFLGKMVMGGKSTAPHHSAEFQAYRRGVKQGAGGLLFSYSCFLVVSVVHGKLVNFWGLKADWCVSLSLMMVSVLSLVLSRHMAAFYVCCVAISLVRSTLYSVPYIIASDFVQDREKTGEPVSGKTVARLTCMLPLSALTVFTISGPLITLTHNPGAPLVLSSACAGLGAVLFFCLYRP